MVPAKFSTRIPLIVILTCFVGCGIATAVILPTGKMIREVNEPDPAKFDPAIIVRNLKVRGVDVRIDKIRYVYLDVTSYVFEGEIKYIDQSVWHVSQGGSLFVGKPKGVIVLSESKSGTCLIGFTDQSGDPPMDPHFEKHYMEFSSPEQKRT